MRNVASAPGLREFSFSVKTPVRPGAIAPRQRHRFRVWRADHGRHSNRQRCAVIVAMSQEQTLTRLDGKAACSSSRETLARVSERRAFSRGVSAGRKLPKKRRMKIPQVPCAGPSGAIEEQRGVCALCDATRYLVEVQLHGECAGERKGKRGVHRGRAVLRSEIKSL